MSVVRPLAQHMNEQYLKLRESGGLGRVVPVFIEITKPALKSSEIVL